MTYDNTNAHNTVTHAAIYLPYLLLKHSVISPME